MWFQGSRVRIPSIAHFSGKVTLTTLEALLLGIIQGVTEFLPVSSSGHLQLFQHLLGLENLSQFLVFDLVCHTGTLFAILVVYQDKIREMLFYNQKRLFQVLIGTIPLFFILPILSPIKALYGKPEFLGWFFLLTSALLFCGIKFGKNLSTDKLQASKWRDPFIIGLFQCLALLPGVSRSGSTISISRVLGWKMEDALSFSFLLVLPAILGGMTLEVLQLIIGSQDVFQVELTQYVTGFFTSFVIGYVSLLLLIRLAVKNRFMYFVWYTLILGIITLIHFY